MNPAAPTLRKIARLLIVLLALSGFGFTALSQEKPDAPVAPLPGAAPAPATAGKQRLSAKDRKEIFEKIWKEIHDHYYDASYNGVDWGEVHRRYAPLVESARRDQEFYALMSQMTSELHDAHTRFSSPEQWRNFRRQQGVTVGFSVDDMDGETVVTNVIPGTEAARAGIGAGMVVLRVDDVPVAERIAEIEQKRLPSSSERATRWFIYNRVFAGPADAAVKVALQRADGSVFEVSVRRQIYSEAPRVTTHVLPSGNVYIRFDGFQHPITKEFREALEKFRGAPGLIVDLRRNGGGDLAVLLPIAGYFFGKKTLFAKDSTRTGKPLSSYVGLFKLPLQLYVGHPGEQIYSGPVVILVDAHSASSSEVFAAGMQDTLRAKVIGSQSCGCVLGIAKPRVMKGGGVLEMSEVLWFSPKGRKLEGTGIIPDQLVTPTMFDLQRGRDAVLAAADKSLVKAAVLESKETGGQNGKESEPQ
jgi:carboxyl-terminal processing protease